MASRIPSSSGHSSVASLEWSNSSSRVTSKEDLRPPFSRTSTLPGNLSSMARPRPRALGRYPQTVQYSMVTMGSS